MGSWTQPPKEYTWGWIVQALRSDTTLNVLDDKPPLCSSCHEAILSEQMIFAESAGDRFYYHADCVASMLFRYAKYAAGGRRLLKEAHDADE